MYHGFTLSFDSVGLVFISVHTHTYTHIPIYVPLFLFIRSAPSSLTGKVNQLEVILRQLQNDLRKVR